MLALENLLIRQGAFCLAADFEIAPGQKLAIIGPSGAGKSTLLSVIAGFFAPASGRVTWEGRDLTDVPADARPVTMLFQDNNLFPHMSVAQNVELGIRPNLRLSEEERARVAEVIARVGLAGLEDRKPLALSGGQIARVGLARALVRARPIMLLDEPFGALGPALKSEMLALVDELVRETGATLLMVSHDPEDARTLGDAVVLVADGIAHAPEPLPGALDAPSPALAAYLG